MKYSNGIFNRLDDITETSLRIRRGERKVKGIDKFYSYKCGKLLGDWCITKQENRKPRFHFISFIELKTSVDLTTATKN